MISKATNKIFIIAEAGVNHNGSYNLAKKLIDKASNAGADAIKFQIFKADKLAIKNSKKAKYQKNLTNKNETQYEMLKKLELSNDSFIKLRNYCRKKKIEFLSSIFDEDSLDFLVDILKIKKIKIPSGEITNGPLLYKAAKSNCDIILSTGMSNIYEIRKAISIICYGYLSIKNKHQDFKLIKFNKAFKSQKAQKILRNKLTLLHCTTEYPTPYKDINLNAMLTLSKEFNLKIGYSDHSKGYFASLMASAMGAKIIEKHFTIDKNLPGPDHKASLDASELKEMIKEIKNVKMILGKSKKEISKSELKNLFIARKVIVAKQKINKGDKFSEDNIIAKRAGKGMSPMLYWELLGKISKKNFKKDQIIKL